MILNSGAALVAGDRADTLPQGIELARAAIADGKATQKLDAMITLTQELADNAH